MFDVKLRNQCRLRSGLEWLELLVPLVLFALLASACQGEIEGGNGTPSPPPDPHDQADDDETVYWATLEGDSSSQAFYAIAGFSENELYLTGEAGNVWLWDGSSLTLLATLTTGDGDATDLNGVWAWSDERGKLLFVVGSRGAIFRYEFDSDGFEVMETNTKSAFKGVLGFGRDNVWAVGDGGIYHFDGESWSRDTNVPGSSTLYAIWGGAHGNPEDLYAVGLAGVILHHVSDSGDPPVYSWEPVSLGRGEDLHSVWGTDSGTVYVVGQQGLVLRFDGTSWEPAETGVYDHLWSVWGIDNSSVFALGTNGTTLFFNGEAWQRLPSGTHKNLYGAWGKDIEHVFGVGAWSTLLLYDNDPTPPPVETGD